jgi:urea carboxylase
MFSKVLVANRGEIACRVIRTLNRLGIDSVAIYSEVDRHTAHTSMATESVCIGAAPAAESYLQYDRILEAAKSLGVEAIHPGYGFLSENLEFAAACAAVGIAFIGPTAAQIQAFGLKHTARSLARDNVLPLLSGTELLETIEVAREAANQIGYPIMLKSTAGGGGIGMQVCQNEIELNDAYVRVQRLSQSNFKQSGVFLEKYISIARHIEVQIFGDGKGKVIALGDRDCSTQRRNQKVIEETPAPNLTDAQHQQLADWAIRLGEAVNYRSAGTVEFIYDVEAQQFYFLEVNTRLQVEHGVTEVVCGIDLVEWMVRMAAGDCPEFYTYQHRPQGHAIQVRLYAEDPYKNFQPSSGTLSAVTFPDGVRVDGWVETGTEVTPYYDPLLAKTIVWGEDRSTALTQMGRALAATELFGIETNLDYLRQVLAEGGDFAAANLRTGLLKDFSYQPKTIEVIEAGTFTTIQDYPGRLGYWAVGVPPSGPMDDLAFRLANRVLGNPEGAAALECTIAGSILKFNLDRTICLTGALMEATLDGQPVPYWQAIEVKAGSILRVRGLQDCGYRTYIAFRGGLDVPDYLGSKSTFTLGQFGGQAGRILRSGDVLRLADDRGLKSISQPLTESLIPQYTHNWEIAVLYGPHGAPDFFTPEDIETFFNTDWKIHHNSSRTGIRLIGSKPKWARVDGGEAGLHPSNIHDNAYAIGTIDFTGDMPIILGVDGPSLGGFVCPVTIVGAELWKIGQLKPNDRVRFRAIDYDEAVLMAKEREKAIANLTALPTVPPTKPQIEPPILAKLEPLPTAVTYRQAGDRYLLIEYGDLVLDLHLRFRVRALMAWLETNPIQGIIDLTPGIRSLQIHFDNRLLSRRELLDRLVAAERELGSLKDLEVPTRIVHLPISWDDSATQLAIQKYMQSVRNDAPWCPSNLEFIRRINGLDSIEEVRQIFFAAEYLVLGLGDVYLGAPVATPLDPRHRLVTTKYNPARTWTPENAVGIGGAYLCIYGMEGPGGYQFTGRTIQVWNRYRQTADFPAGKPWLLEFFDRLKFYPVTAEELLQIRSDFLAGKFQLHIETSTFSLREYDRFLQANASEINAFKQKQQTAFQAERDRWAAMGEFERQDTSSEDEPETERPTITIPPDCRAITAQTAANVWQVAVKTGDRVQKGDHLAILEVMKMEIAVLAEESGLVREIYCKSGQTLAVGDLLLAIAPEIRN